MYGAMRPTRAHPGFLERSIFQHSSPFIKVFICQHFRAPGSPPLPWPNGCGIPSHGPGGGGGDIPYGVEIHLNNQSFSRFITIFGDMWWNGDAFTLRTVGWDAAVLESMRAFTRQHDQ